MAKIRQTVEVEIEPTPCDLAQAIWEMDAEEQLDFLYALAEVAPLNKILAQMQAIRDDMKASGLDSDMKIKAFVRDLYDYICGEEGYAVDN